MTLSPEAQAVLDAATRASAPPSGITLPEWCSTLRIPQIEAINNILDAYNRGIDCVVLDAPTGTGKTLIAECVRQCLNLPGTYICSSKTLQDQFLHDFKYAHVLKGRSNYPTLAENRNVTAADCNKSGGDGEAEQWCSWCSDRIRSCPYEVAKGSALQSQLAVLNTSYLLTEANGPGRFSGRKFIICDEADTLENELLRYISVDLTETITRKYNIPPPKLVTKEESWIEWAEVVLPKLRDQVRPLRRYESDVRKIREHLSLQNLLSKVFQLLQGLRDGGWVYVGGKGSRFFSFKPIQVDKYGQEKLWKHGSKWLLMSATIISPGQLLDDLGWDQNFEYVAVGSGFKKESREIKVIPTADMSRKANERSELISGIRAVLARHRGERILIHTVSYDLAQSIHQGIGRERDTFTYANAGERETALTGFGRTEGAVLIAPSFDRGVDLPDDKCRVVIVAKVPYPYLGDKQVSSRLYGTKGGQNWYAVQTARSIVQMTGRATRHDKDFSVNYILDKQFVKFYRENGRLFPNWWKEAVNWNDRLGVK